MTSYTRPAVAVQLTQAEKTLALRALRTIQAPIGVRRLLDYPRLWAFQAVALAGWLDRAGERAPPLSRTRRHAHQLARRYRQAAHAAKTMPIDPAEWPEAPHRKKISHVRDQH
jgi:hypothetical protein